MKRLKIQQDRTFRLDRLTRIDMEDIHQPSAPSAGDLSNPLHANPKTKGSTCVQRPGAPAEIANHRIRNWKTKDVCKMTKSPTKVSFWTTKIQKPE